MQQREEAPSFQGCLSTKGRGQGGLRRGEGPLVEVSMQVPVSTYMCEYVSSFHKGRSRQLPRETLSVILHMEGVLGSSIKGGVL